MLHTKNVPARWAQPVHGVKLVVMGVVLAVGGTIALSSWAQPAGPQDGPPPPPRHGMHHGPKGGHGAFGGHGLFMAPPERIDRGVDHYLKGVNASDAQRAQVKQIVRAAAADLKPIHEATRGLRTQQQQQFTATVVDARAVEATRVQLLQQHDQASKRITQAMLDISAVLSPEQRAKLAEQAKQRQERMKDAMQKRQMQRRGAASAPAQ
ncbi:MAG: Spy/CpxP family protein refolding chaperone [Rhizobacter sp.]